MKNSLFLYMITASVLGSTAFADTVGTDILSKDWTWVASVAGGPIWAKGGETQSFYLSPEIEKTYVARKASNDFSAGELFVGVQKSLGSQWLGQVGLAAVATDYAKLQGVIWDDADPQLDNYSYFYKVQHSSLTVKGKLLLDQGYRLIPWVSASLGVAFNRAYAFNNTPLIFEAVPNSNFTSHTKTSLTYTLGAGVQKVVEDHWQIGVGYEFADWGKSELGRAPGQTQNTGLILNHLYTNGISFNLTYIA